MKSASSLRRVSFQSSFRLAAQAASRAAFRALMIGLCTSTASSVFAQQTYYWDTNPSTATTGNDVRDGGSGTWNNTTANFTRSITDSSATSHNLWSSAAPLTGVGTLGTDRVIFGGAVGGIVQLDAFAPGAQLPGLTSAGVNSLSFETDGYSLQGSNVLRLYGPNPGISVSSNFTATINNVISNLIGGSGISSLTKSDTGLLTLGGVNTYTGVTTINGGVLSVSTLANGNLSSGIGQSSNAAGNLVLNGGTLQYVGAAVSSDRAFTLGISGGTLDASGSGALNLTSTSATTLSSTNTARTLTLTGTNTGSNTYGGILGNNGTGLTSLTKTGVGTWVLNRANTYTGATLVSNGTLRAGVTSVANTNGAFGNNSAVTLANIAGTTLDITGFNTQIGSLTGGGTTGGNVILGAATLTVGGDNSSPAAYAGVVSGTGGSLIKIGSGTLVLSGANTYTGATTINVGTLRAGVSSVANISGALGNNSAVTLANFAGATFDINGFDTQIGSLTGGGTTGGNISLGAATLTVGGNNLSLAPYAGVISGTNGSLTKIGGGVLLLSGANTYTGVTTVTSGVLSVSNLANGDSGSGIGASSNAASNLVLNGTVLNGSTLRYTGGAASSDRSFTLGTGGGLLDASGTGALNLSSTSATALLGINTARTLTLTGTNTGSNTYAGILGNNGTGLTSLAKNGTGTWVLSGANIYTGATTVSDGTLSAGVTSVANTSGAFGNNSAVTLANVAGATLDITGFDTQIGSLTGGGTTGGDVNLGAATLTVGGNNSSPAAYAGVVSGTSGSLTKIGSGTLVLSGANTYTGVTTVSSGILSLANVANGGISSGIGASSNAASNLVLNGGTLRYTGGGASSDRSFTLGTSGGTLEANGSGALNLTSTGPTTLLGTNAARTLTLTGTNTGSNTNAGILGNNGTGATSLTKAGTGTWVLGSANTYTGVTTINSGVLSVSTLANGNVSSGIGQSSNAAGNLVLNGGTLQYVGAAVSSDRAFTLGTAGGTIDASGSGALNLSSTSATAFSGSIAARTLTLTGTNTGNNTYAGILVNGTGGTTSLTKTGVGTWVLNNASTYTGPTAINGGVLTLNTVTGSLGSTSAISLGGGTFNLDNTGAVGALSESLGSLTFSSRESTVSISRTADLNQAVTFSSLGARVAGATGNFVNAGGANGSINGFTLTGRAAGFIDQGTFFGGNSYAWMNAAGTFVRGINYGTDLGSTNTTASVTSLPATTHALVSGSGVVTAQSSATISTLRIDNANNFTLAAGQTLTVNGILKSGNAAGGSITGGTGIQAANNVELVVRTDGASDTLTVATPILANGNNALTKSGAGTLTLSGANTYTGTTSLNAGTLEIGVGNIGSVGAITSSAIGRGTLVLNGGTISSNGTTARTILNPVTVGGDFAIGDATNNGAMIFSATTNLGTVTREITTASAATLVGIVSGSGGLTKAGPSSLTLSGLNSYTGTTTINGGVLSISNNQNLGALATGATLNINNGTLRATTSIGLWNNTPGTNNRNVVLNGVGGTFDIAGAFETLSIAGTISGLGGLTKTGPGFLEIRQASYSGPTNVNAGTLLFGASVDPLNSEFNIGLNGTVNLNGFSNTIGSLAGSGTVTNSGGIATLSVGSIAGNTSFSGRLTNEASGLSLDKFGAGTLTLTGGTNDYTGTTTISGGTLALTGTGVVPASTQLTISSATGTFDVSGISGTTSTVAALSGVSGSSVVLGGKQLMMSSGVTNDTFTYAGTISGTGGLSKEGLSEQIFTAANIFSGPTTITGGILRANNTTGSALGTSNVTVNGSGFDGAIFGGTGTISGTVTLSNGGILDPGASVGTLRVGGATGSGILNIEYDSFTGIFDRLNVTGGLNLDNFSLNFVDIAALPGILTGQSYIFANAGSRTGTTNIFDSISTTNTLGVTTSGVPNGYLLNYAFGAGGNNIALVAVPEPGSLALLVVAGLGGAWYRRKQVQKSATTKA